MSVSEADGREDNGPLEERAGEVRRRLARLPRQRLAHLPTPLDPCPNLSADLDAGPIWLKRDDCTGLGLGGNKSRQLEYILGDALAQGADCLIQGAGTQSNHSRQLAAAAAKLGIDCYITNRSDAGGMQGNFLATTAFGPTFLPVPHGTSVAEHKRRLADSLRAQGRSPYVLGMGAADTLALAAVSYVEAMIEIVEALARAGEAPPDVVYVTSQGGTQAGLLLGARLLGLTTRVVGINPMDSREEAFLPPSAIVELVARAAAALEVDADIRSTEIVNLTDYVGERYGMPSPGSVEAIRTLARREGVLVDPVYSGKGLSGFLDHLRRRVISATSTSVFVHTGGVPAIFAHADNLEL